MAGTRDYQRNYEDNPTHNKGKSKYDRTSDDPERSGEDGRATNVHRWNDRTPTGLRDRVDEEEASKLVNRPPQTQHISQDESSPRKFTRTQFVAHVSDRMSFNRNGDLNIQIVVPYQFKHLAEPLTDAFGIPLSFDVEVWRPYQEADI